MPEIDVAAVVPFHDEELNPLAAEAAVRPAARVRFEAVTFAPGVGDAEVDVPESELMSYVTSWPFRRHVEINMSVSTKGTESGTLLIWQRVKQKGSVLTFDTLRLSILRIIPLFSLS